MSSEKEGLKKKLLKESEKRLDEGLNERSGKRLWEMEDEVQAMKNGVGKEVMEAK